MATSITIDGTLTNDQSELIQNNDVDIGYDSLTNTFSSALLSAGFVTYLNGLFATLLDADADAFGSFANNAEAARSATNFVTVNGNGATVTNLSFSDPDGDPLNGDQVFLPGGAALTTIGGDAIYLWSVDDNTVLATTSNVSIGAGDLVAAFYLNEATNHLSAGVEIVTFIPLFHPDPTDPDDSIDWTDVLNVSAAASLVFNFDSLQSGSSLWAAVGSSGAALLVSGKTLDVDAAGKKTNASDTVHISQGGTGTTIGINNQLFDNAGETAVFTLVTGFSNTTLTNTGGAIGDSVVDPKPNDNKPEGIDYSGYLNVTGAGIFVSQSQGNDPKDFDINLYRAGGAGGTTPEEGFGYIGTEPSGAFDNDIAVNAATVTIRDDDGVIVGVWAVAPGAGQLASGTLVNDHVSTEGTADVRVTISGNNIDIDGVLDEYTVSWTSASGETLNRFQLVAEAGQFDVGRVEITEGLTVTTPVGDKIFVQDDGPESAVGQAVDPLVVDDSDIDGPSTDFELVTNFFPSFDFNLDGGGTATVALSVSSPNVSSGLVDTLSGATIRFVVEGGTGDVLGYVDLNGSSSNDGEPIALRYHLSAEGAAGLADDRVTLTQYRAVVHDDPTDPDEASFPKQVAPGTVFIDLTVTDGDLDQSVQNFDLSQISFVKDDGPVLSGQTATANVDEDDMTGAGGGDLSTGITDGDADGDEDTFTNAQLQLTIDPGEDLPVTFALNAAVAGAVVDTGGNQLFSKGEALSWAVSGSEVQAVAGGRVVFALTQSAGAGTPNDPGDDVFTVDLKDQLDHAAGGDGATLTVDLTPAFTATDADGDPADLNGGDGLARPIQLVVENDVPTITAQILNGTVAFSSGSSVTNSLNGAIGGDDNTAANLTGSGTFTYTFDGYTTPINAFPNLTAVLSADGTKIEYFSNGVLFYDIVLSQAAAGAYTFTVYQSPPPAVLEFDFAALPSGQSLFGVIAQSTLDLDGLGLAVLPDNAVLSAAGTYTNTSGTINTSQGGGPVTIGNGNQMFDNAVPDEGAYFAYISNPDDDAVAGVPGGLTQNTADDADTLGFVDTFEFTTASVEIVQVQGQANSAALSIKAFDIEVGDPVDTSSEARSFVLNPTVVSDAVSSVAQVNVTGVKVYDQNGVLIEHGKDINNDGITELQDIPGADDNANIVITFSGLTASVAGLNDDYKIEFTTETGHDLVQIERVAGSYDIGGFNIIQEQITPDQQFDFSVRIRDYDGDAYGGDAIAFANFSVGVDGTDADLIVNFIV